MTSSGVGPFDAGPFDAGPFDAGPLDNQVRTFLLRIVEESSPTAAHLLHAVLWWRRSTPTPSDDRLAMVAGRLAMVAGRLAMVAGRVGAAFTGHGGRCLLERVCERVCVFTLDPSMIEMGSCYAPGTLNMMVWGSENIAQTLPSFLPYRTIKESIV
jgi:hypothetical protein